MELPYVDNQFVISKIRKCCLIDLFLFVIDLQAFCPTADQLYGHSSDCNYQVSLFFSNWNEKNKGKPVISQFLRQEQQRGWSLANAASALAAALYTVANDDAVENCSDAVRLNHIPHKNSKFKISSKNTNTFKKISTDPYIPFQILNIQTNPNRSQRIQKDPSRSIQIQHIQTDLLHMTCTK